MDKKEIVDEALKTQVDSLLETIADDTGSEKNDHKEEEIVKLLDGNRLLVGTQEYELSIDHREGFDPEALAGRYTSILSKYDYIVGDWGYDQLRLKGFYRNNNSKVAQDKKISFLEDYLYEYCNFGCAYFVIEKTRADKEKITKTKRNRKRKNREANREELPADTTAQAAAKPNHAPAQTNKNKEIKNKIYAIKVEIKLIVSNSFTNLESCSLSFFIFAASLIPYVVIPKLAIIEK